MDEPPSWTAEHFSLANPLGQGQGDVPLLLRRAAAAIEAIGDVRILDLMLHTEVNEFGNWPSVTIYFRRDRPAQPAANEFQSRQWSDS
jgi:hypothetical protein